MSYPQATQTRLDPSWSPESYDMGALPAYGGSPGFGGSLAELRNRARDLERRNVLACAVLDRAVENVIGTGIDVRPTSSSPEFNDEIEKLWAEWTKGKRADVRRMYSFGQLQQLAYRAYLRDGDVAFLLIDQGTGYGPEIQLIEAHSIATPYDVGNRRIEDGVELDNNGRPIAFHVRTYDNAVEKFQRVLAQNVVFIARSTRYGMVRGESVFNGAFTLFDQIVGYLDSVVVAARVGATQCILIPRPKGSLAKPFDKKSTTTDGAGNVVEQILMEPGTATFYDGEAPHAFNPSQPQATFTDALRTFCRFVGLKVGLTIERVLLDFTKANYSVSRSTSLQEMKTSDLEQANFDAAFFARIYPWFTSKQVKLGRVKAAEPDDSWNYEWIPNGRPLQDPSKELPGLIAAVELGIESRRNIAASTGYKFKQLVKDNAEDEKLMLEAGLDPHAASSKTAAAIAAAPQPVDENTPADPAPAGNQDT
jgi:lambda family phage portal protein